jgi:hypothetical protein
MPASRRSLQLTDSYRRRLLALGNQAERLARAAWPTIEELDATDWPERTAASLSQAQTQAVRLSAGYLAAYARSEGATGTVPATDSARYAGLSRDGRPLAEALQSPLIGVRAALKQGRPPAVALQLGLTRGLRTASFEVVQTGREALIDAIAADGRFEGFQRSVAGTCAACMALSAKEDMEVHPGCQCTPQPVVAGARDRFPLPTGAALFGSLSKPEQDAAIGEEPARLVRDGDADLEDFVQHNKQAELPDFITQRPVEDVAAT